MANMADLLHQLKHKSRKKQVEQIDESLSKQNNN